MGPSVVCCVVFRCHVDNFFTTVNQFSTRRHPPPRIPGGKVTKVGSLPLHLACCLVRSLALVTMGNKSSLMLQEQDIEDIQTETGFLPSQIERLYSRFTSLDKGDNGSLSREDFLRIPELAINPLGDRIVHAFFKESDDDHVNFRQFVRVLARFRPIKRNQVNKLNAREEKLRFAFKMYDLDDDERISREELLAVLHMMVGENISDEQLNSIAERTIIEADRDGDQMISFEEFCDALERTDVEQKMSIKFLK